MGNVVTRYGAVYALLPLLLGALAVGALINEERHPPVGHGVQSLRTGLFLSSDALSPATLSFASARQVALPHAWRDLRPLTTSGWYQLHFSLSRLPVRNWDIFIPQLRLNAEAYINGEPVRHSGRLHSPISRYFNYPLILPIPPAALRPGNNVLLIHVVTEPADIGSLGTVYVGPISGLKQAYLNQYALKVVAPLVIAVAMLLMCLFMGGLWLRRPQDTAYAYFTAAVLAWLMATLDFCIPNPPLSAQLWDALTFAAIAWMSSCYALFVHRYIGTRHPRFERALWYYAVLYTATLLLIPDYRLMFRFAADFGNIINALIWLYCCLRFFMAYRQRHERNTLLMWSVSLFTLAFAIHYVLALSDVWIGSDSRYMYFAAPLILAGFAWGLIDRFVLAFNTAETLNQQLERRIADKTRELSASHQKLRTLESERLLLAERTRIMRDMHDGVGGQLVSTLAAVEHGGNPVDIATDLRRALTDLRLLIDSMDPQISDTAALLGALREHLDRWTRSHGLALAWDAEMAAPVHVTPEFSLHIMRIVQESITNVLKHAQASLVAIRIQFPQDVNGCRHLQIELSDDGCGSSQDTAAPAGHAARGLESMRYRAERLGGRFEMRSEARGTCLVLSVPLPATDTPVPKLPSS